MKMLNILILMLLGTSAYASTENANSLTITDADFNCVLDMEPVRGFYVDNLIDGQLSSTVAVAEAGEGEYPAGSVVQLVPGEVMVKHPKGFNIATKDWEFFELNVSAQGTEIGKRGFVDVINRFGGNCFGCHVKAKPEFDMICETGHGCDPIPLTPQITKLLQNTDARCGGRYKPTAEDMVMLKALAAQLGGN
ncbi:MAG: hypothetical protein ACI92E_000314 [Oceanicoccus sp.]|jgi:hypothetical protein